MARRNYSLPGCAVLLAIGLAAGGHLEFLRLTTRVSAVPRESAESPMSAVGMALVQSGEHISQVSAQVLPSVVHIQAVRVEKEKKVEETGSGVMMRSSTARGLFAITNQHVIRGAELRDIEIQLADGSTVNPLRIYRDSESDIAVLQLPDGGQAGGQWGDSSTVEIGHFVLAVGSPFGLSQSVTMGIVSAKGRRDLSLASDQVVTNQDFLQTDAAINPGNSGGPLIDMYGTVVGINTAIASNGGGNEGIGFSIPSNLAHRVFEQLVVHGRVRRAYLGVELDNNFSDEVAERLGLSRNLGARIVRIYNQKNSPAVRAGLRPDDVILSFNGVEVIDENHLINLVSLSDIGAAVDIEVYRGRQKSRLKVVLTDREEYRTADDPRNTFNTR